MELKDTLLMPQTSFAMRGNLPENEELQRITWENMDLYHKIQEQNKDNTPFVLHDGPPYANGNLHCGHALNKIIKDFINRYHMLKGNMVTYIPGWDTHGLPIEQAITNSGVDRKAMTKSEFRALCQNYAQEQVQNQMNQFKTLNVIADWDHPYVTFDPKFEACQIEVFANMAKQGLIYKGLKPVYWSPSSESALAEAEIEYKDKKDPSIYVAFPVETGNEFVSKGDYLVIWTTTPWTLPGNLGICVGEEFTYLKVAVHGKHYVVAKELYQELKELFDWENADIESHFSGKELKGVTYKHVFMDRVSPVITGSHVTLDAGTGLVHTAPGYGVDDFNVGRLHNLGLISAINDQGYLTEESGPFAGLYYEDANKEITKKLDELGVLLKLKFITHSYPHDWRTKKPVIFRATPQWFCSIDPIREKILNQIEHKIKWNPEWGKVRLYNMIKDRGDWCISRQRVWGLPIPIFYNEDGSEIIDYDIMMHVASLIRKYGSNIWFEWDVIDLLPDGYENPASPNKKFRKEEDIMDVWFDSGSSHTGVLKENQLPYPADVYLEGSDQYRGWFNSSLITGVAIYGCAPYKQVISHGFVLDGKGDKMSKSLGNTIDPIKMVKLHGADVFRLWASSVDYTEDAPISDELIGQVKESYRKIRNTYRFMLGNLFDFDPSKQIEYKDMSLYDQYLMVKFNKVMKTIKQAYENYNFSEIYKTVNHFISFTLSNFYLDFTKDILYIEASDSKVRRSVQTVLYHVLFDLIRTLAPILPYTSEEVYQLLPNKKKESIHLESYPEIRTYENEEDILSTFEIFFAIKDDVYKALEKARNDKIIGKSLEAQVKVYAEGRYLEVLKQLESDMSRLLIVSDVVLTNERLTVYDVCEVEVAKAPGVKCERCWNYVLEELEDGVCHRCSEVIQDKI